MRRSLITVISMDACKELVHGKVWSGEQRVTVDKRLFPAATSLIKEASGVRTKTPVVLMPIEQFVCEDEIQVDELMDVFPLNANHSVILSMTVEEDQVLTVSKNGYEELAASLVDELTKSDLVYVKKQLKEMECGEAQDLIFFAPFITLEHCRRFAVLDAEFGLEDAEFFGIQDLTMEYLKSFD